MLELESAARRDPRSRRNRYAEKVSVFKEARAMTHDQLNLYFWISLGLGLPLGLALTILWAKKILPGLLRWMNRQPVISLRGISVKAFIYMVPGLLLLIICSVPALYFNYWLKQEQYCIQVVQVNEKIEKDHPIFQERCSCLDVDELFLNAGR
jgi:hypothetical protein